MYALEWRDVQGYEGSYQVSNLGEVRSLDRVTSHNRVLRGRVLKVGAQTDGHVFVRLSVANKQKQVPVHKLVMETFVGPRPAPDMDICHNNGDPTDNRLMNLRYDTKRANRLDDVLHGKNVQSLRTHCPRGHELSDWNNVNYYREIGRRTCKACGNARTHARNKGTTFSSAKADEYYERGRLAFEQACTTN